MAGVWPCLREVSLAGTLILACGLASGPAGSESTVAVMVLCPGDLPEGIPGCEDVAQALDVEIEEFSMYALPGPSPDEITPQEVAGPGVPFVVWSTAFDDQLVLHVYEASNAVEVSKTLDLGTMEEVPTAYDLAILYTNLMGTSLYAGLAELEEGELIDLAIPEEKESVILERAASGKGKAELPAEFEKWFPQFALGWSLVSYPGTHNAGNRISDVYNGLVMSLRLPFPGKFWAGASVTLTQSVIGSFEYDLPPSVSNLSPGLPNPIRTSTGSFNDDQIVITADGAWYPYQSERIGVWIAFSPGITRTSTEVSYFGENLIDEYNRSATSYRMSLAASAGFQVTAVPRVNVEAGLRLGYLFRVWGADRLWITPDHTRFPKYDYKFYESGNFQLAFWMSMVFG